VCGDTACDLDTHQCCGLPFAGCQLKFPPVCVVTVQINCDDALDCPANQTCCATRSGNAITSANCQDDCRGTVICNDSRRCPTGTTCQPFDGLEHYRICAAP
jgi:hypothetical protein